MFCQAYLPISVEGNSGKGFTDVGKSVGGLIVGASPVKEGVWLTADSVCRIMEKGAGLNEPSACLFFRMFNAYDMKCGGLAGSFME
ncbi:hypothetical protein [Paludibacterium paludis]|uniref:Uncharacterized protein n=1 Tax=Paludibacterium paludis TaxID=1225769 RepID=A0A918P1G8_9NEIS|nr:hypothetical protein [Paludibacterium paludis]GGY12176.1 hypothetical protein GCM10011289_14080 [Paludibacterium paludis]